MHPYITEVKSAIAFRFIYNMFCEAFGDTVWSERTFRHVLKHCVYISHDNTVIEKGGVIIRKVCDEVEILNIAVHPKYQSQGIGKGLIDKAMTYYPDAKKIFLEVATDNTRALHLYKSMGFQRVGKRQKYYCRNGAYIDAWVMQYVRH